MIEVKYKEDKLVLTFTDKGWEIWIAICFIKNIYRIRWDLDFTDRDRGFIEDLYGKMEKAGIDFEKFDAGIVTSNSMKDSMKEIRDDLKVAVEHLKELNPTLKIIYDKKL